MKIFVKQDGIILVGKAWEIRAKLTEYRKHFATVKEWIDSDSTPR